MTRRFFCIAALVLGSTTGACAGHPEPRALDAAPAPPPIVVGEGRVQRIETRADVHLLGERVDAKPGDYLLSHDGMQAVVTAEDGYVVDFAPEGTEDALVSLSPGAFDALTQVRAPVVRAWITGPGDSVLGVERRAAFPPIRLFTYFTFQNDVLVVSTRVEPETRPDGTSSAGSSVGLGERVGWGNTPTFIEGYGFARRAGAFVSASFLAREGPLDYALALADGPLKTRVGSVSIQGFFAAPRASELTVVGEGRVRTLLLSASQVSIGDAARKILPPGATFTAKVPPGLPSDARIEVARCVVGDVERPPFAVFSPSEPEVVVPDGCFDARLWAPGRATTPWVTLDQLFEQKLPATGTLAVEVTEGPARSPARVQVRGIDPTETPDFGDDPDEGAANNVVHTGSGSVVRELTPGRYRVVVDHGFERTAHVETVEIEDGKRTTVHAALERVVDTRGFISADLHLHAVPSPDAPQSLEDRVRSLAAAGVEVGVATDHNKVTDYREAIRAEGLGAEVASIVGDEVTTEDTQFGHFNVFPLEPGSAPLRFEGTSPSALFAEARAQRPLGAETILQVNHPRMGDIGYFDLIRLDTADVTGLMRRRPDWLGFDALEVYNGDDAVEIDNVEWVMRDWQALLAAGLRVTATGNSDSHRLSFHEPGLPRNLVALQDDRPSAFDPAPFLSSVREGRVVVSGGPFVQLEIEGVGMGGTVAPGRRLVHVWADAPPWMDISSLEVWTGTRIVARADAPFAGAKHRAELEESVALLPGDHVFAVVRGKREMDVLWRRGVVPFAFTNAVHVAGR